jgi:putative transposase
MVMIKYKDMVPVRWLCNWTGTSKSSWYYSSSEGKRGRKPSRYTLKSDGEKVDNSKVVGRIKELFRDEFLSTYGYEKVCWELQGEDYLINKKKVYRLMKEAHLLCPKGKIHTSGKRTFVQQRVIDAEYPMQYLTMDIKYVYIHGERRNVYLLTIMDVFTRKVLGHILKPSIRQHDVILLLDGIIQEYDTEGMIIRNDNGSQFIAHSVRRFLQERGINQEFTHIATPEENAYIEALHSVIERDVIRRCWFDSIYHAKMKMADYYRFYNSRRRHRSLNKKCPDQYWKMYYENLNQKSMLNQQTLLN